VSFQWPYALLALVVVPLLIAAYILWDRRRQSCAARFTHLALLPNLIEREPGRLRHLPRALMLIAVAAMLVGVARPHATVSVKREEATVVLALDVSRSMEAADVVPTRLAAARAAAKAFLRTVPSKFRVAVVSFGSRAIVSLPPTTDRTLANQALDELQRGEGTAIGDAVVLSVRLGQRQRTADGRVPPEAVLMISDGAQTAGRTSVRAAIAAAHIAHVPIYTILVGTSNGVVYQTLIGGFREMIRVPPSPNTLRALAVRTGGQFFTARNDSRLRDIYQRLGSRLGSTRESREITDVFAGGSAGLMLAGAAISVLWFRRLV
jgi:Ca-activated chloride channel homolog